MAKRAVAPNASHHYAGFGIKGDNLDENDFARYMVGIRMKDFESGNNIETETDEGHTGVSNLDMGSYRTSAESEPSWEEKLRFKEGLEDVFYLLLGTFDTNPQESEYDFGTDASVNHFRYYFPPTDAPELPCATIYNGFAKTTDDARAFNNAYLNELEVSMSNEEAPTIKPTFVSDYNNFNLANPTRNYSAKSEFVKPKGVNVYYGDVGLSVEELFEKKLSCFMESSYTINYNYEKEACTDDEFGKTTKFKGKTEVTGSFKVPWTEKTKKLEPEYEGGNIKAHSVTEEVLEKQIIYEYVGRLIGETGINYRMIVHFPIIELTKAESPLSGDEAKDLTIEYKVKEVPTTSFMFVDIWTDLEEHHIDTQGVDLEDLFYVEPTAPNAPATNTYNVEFTVTDGTDPVEDATVAVGSLTGTTDSTGKVTISNIPEGNNDVIVTKTGFQDYSESKNITSNDGISITLTSN